MILHPRVKCQHPRVKAMHSSLKFLHPRVPASYAFSSPSCFTQNHHGVDFAAPRPSLHQPGPRALPAAAAVKRIVCNYSACCSDLQPIIVIKLSKCCDSSSAGIGIQVKLYPLGRNYIITFNIFQSSLLALWWFSKLVSSYVHACSLSPFSLDFWSWGACWQREDREPVGRRQAGQLPRLISCSHFDRQ